MVHGYRPGLELEVSKYQARRKTPAKYKHTSALLSVSCTYSFAKPTTRKQVPAVGRLWVPVSVCLSLSVFSSAHSLIHSH